MENQVNGQGVLPCWAEYRDFACNAKYHDNKASAEAPKGFRPDVTFFGSGFLPIRDHDQGLVELSV